MSEHKQFKPFDRVLVREEVFPEWTCGFYSHYDNEKNRHITTVLTKVEDKDILPYEGNEHLVGTTDEPEEEVELEEGEWIMVCDDLDCFIERWELKKLKEISYYRGFVSLDSDEYELNWKFAVKFSDFNPNDMEETRKHILCVKNGKVVRYKE